MLTNKLAFPGPKRKRACCIDSIQQNVLYMAVPRSVDSIGRRHILEEVIRLALVVGLAFPELRVYAPFRSKAEAQPDLPVPSVP